MFSALVREHTKKAPETVLPGQAKDFRGLIRLVWTDDACQAVAGLLSRRSFRKFTTKIAPTITMPITSE
ncbi:hypothetical protein SAMN04488127_0474 [Bhargavaea ginsengi]|uniref:Uncharacterized protein n=1 Tax=Bhargavaea ginsengi TaxID=426757 RepID=A0A1H6TRU8_9BACL|nr:hypothetical protein SAMN04488127_0474 [Bhargavaea ginsengi]